jgi:mRNA interferase RelE/StbE
VPWRVEYSARSRRDLSGIRVEDRVRLVKQADRLAEDPRPPGCRKLAGSDALYRVRVGDYRIVYQVEDAVLVVLVVRVAHRRDIYR